MHKLYYKTIYPKKDLQGKSPCLVLLHGRGADENDLLGLSEYFDNQFLIISVRAPYNWDFGFGYTWFEMDENFLPETNSLNQSVNLLNQFLDSITKEPYVAENKIFLFGFSMGAIMGNLISTLYPKKIFANISHSGYLPQVSKYSYNKIPKKPVFIAHGIYDPIIPISFGRETEKVFKNLNADVTYREYPIEHYICEESISDISNWVKNLLDQK